MARIHLSKTDDWELVHPRQDVRGRPLLDAEGRTIGIIDDLFVDTEEECITALILEDGRHFPVRDVELAEEAVHLRTPVAPPAPAPRPEPPPAAPPAQTPTPEAPAALRSTARYVIQHRAVERRPAEGPVGEREVVRIPLPAERAERPPEPARPLQSAGDTLHRGEA